MTTRLADGMAVRKPHPDGLAAIRRGVERKRPQDPAQAVALEKWLIAVQRNFAERILPVDSQVADEWGRMSAARPVSIIDGLVAATA